MATSQNGGLVLEYGDSRLITTVIPGTNGAKFVGGVNGADLNTIFMYVGFRWQTEIEPITPGWCWGHNVRTIRGQLTGYSNHSAGEAIDINAPKHPLGTQTLTSAQLSRLRSIASDLIGVIRFGAFYDGRKDEMHAERVGTYQQVSALAARIRAGNMPHVPDALLSAKPSTPAPAPAPAPAPSPAPAPAPLVVPAYPGGLLRRGSKGAAVRTMQARLNDHMHVIGQATVAVDGDFGPATERAVRLYQWARHGAPFHLAADGIVGPATWASLWR